MNNERWLLVIAQVLALALGCALGIILFWH
jgi:hypothetical protein